MLLNKYNSSSQEGRVALMGKGQVHTILVEKPERMTPPGWSRHSWKSNIKMGLQELESKGNGLDLFGPGYGQLAGSCEWGNEKPGSIKCGNFLSSWGPVSSQERVYSIQLVIRAAMGNNIQQNPEDRDSKRFPNVGTYHKNALRHISEVPNIHNNHSFVYWNEKLKHKVDYRIIDSA